MTDEQRRLLAQYSLRKDSELIALYLGGGLTETATETLRLALSERGIDPDTFQQVSEPTPLEDPMAPPSKIESDVPQPEGLEGWLILVAGGMIIGFVVDIYSLFANYVPLFTNGSWEILTNPLSPNFIPNWGMLIIVEMGALVGFIIFYIVLFRAFFQKLRVFPKLYVALVAASFIFWTVDAAVVSKVMNDPELAMGSSPIGLGSIIWVIYMFVSKRVKNTFVNPRNEAESGETAPIEATVPAAGS